MSEVADRRLVEGDFISLDELVEIASAETSRDLGSGDGKVEDEGNGAGGHVGVSNGTGWGQAFTTDRPLKYPRALDITPLID